MFGGRCGDMRASGVVGYGAIARDATGFGVSEGGAVRVATSLASATLSATCRLDRRICDFMLVGRAFSLSVIFCRNFVGVMRESGLGSV